MANVIPGAERNRAFAETLKAQQGARVTATELATDHSFGDKRIALAAEVVRWLEGLTRDCARQTRRRGGRGWAEAADAAS